MPEPELFSLLQVATTLDAVPWGAPATLAAAAVITGLSAGVFFAFQVAINGALRTVADDTYVATFQSINRYIQNPLFLAVFLGSPVAIAVAGVLHWNDHRSIAWVIGIALLLQVLNVGITMGGNVPLNNQLDQVGTVQGMAATHARAAFEVPWNRLHLIRTAASVASVGALAVASLMAMRQ